MFAGQNEASSRRVRFLAVYFASCGCWLSQISVSLGRFHYVEERNHKREAILDPASHAVNEPEDSDMSAGGSE